MLKETESYRQVESGSLVPASDVTAEDFEAVLGNSKVDELSPNKINYLDKNGKPSICATFSDGGRGLSSLFVLKMKVSTEDSTLVFSDDKVAIIKTAPFNDEYELHRWFTLFRKPDGDLGSEFTFSFPSQAPDHVVFAANQ